MEVDGTVIGGKRHKRSKKKKVVYKQPFFERPEHILFRGNEIFVKEHEAVSSETIAQGTEPVKMEMDGAFA